MIIFDKIHFDKDELELYKKVNNVSYKKYKIEEKDESSETQSKKISAIIFEKSLFRCTLTHTHTQIVNISISGFET